MSTLFSHRFDDGRADEDHLDGFFAKFGGATLDVARELASVAVAQDAKRRAGRASLVRGREPRGPAELLRRKCRKKLRRRRRTAGAPRTGLPPSLPSDAWCSHLPGELCRRSPARSCWLADVGVRGAEAIERRGVGLVVSLDGDDSDFHALGQFKFKGKERKDARLKAAATKAKTPASLGRLGTSSAARLQRQKNPKHREGKTHLSHKTRQMGHPEQHNQRLPG